MIAPIDSISHLTISPGSRKTFPFLSLSALPEAPRGLNPEPGGVPGVIMSPGLSVIGFDKYSIRNQKR